MGAHLLITSPENRSCIRHVEKSDHEVCLGYPGMYTMQATLQLGLIVISTIHN